MLFYLVAGITGLLTGLLFYNLFTSDSVNPAGYLVLLFLAYFLVDEVAQKEEK